MSWRPNSSPPYPPSDGGGCVVGAHDPREGFGFTRTVRWQLAALAAILLGMMAVLGFAVEVAAALLAALLVGVAIDAVVGARTRPAASGRDAG